jgi:hypothetical protein
MSACGCQTDEIFGALPMAALGTAARAAQAARAAHLAATTGVTSAFVPMIVAERVGPELARQRGREQAQAFGAIARGTTEGRRQTKSIQSAASRGNPKAVRAAARAVEAKSAKRIADGISRNDYQSIQAHQVLSSLANDDDEAAVALGMIDAYLEWDCGLTANEVAVFAEQWAADPDLNAFEDFTPAELATALVQGEDDEGP